ncbi:DCC1-like thiol-disulfide oxidoreductase family protein [Kiritimatiellaeota bacterium B1221]|nr:DCC1-like thiol-disulfide oxidoreductase family protein [Kiritimatiellaeota bacterium B1221]
MSKHPLVLFDGPCTLCQRSVRFILRHEKFAELRFSSLQSETGQTQLRAFALPPTIDAMVLILNREAYTGSEAAFRICKYLRWPWRWFYGCRYLPGWMHRPVYRWISRHRYQWFGKNESCPLPDPAQAERFI